jgi:hypothetical protein
MYLREDLDVVADINELYRKRCTRVPVLGVEDHGVLPWGGHQFSRLVHNGAGLPAKHRIVEIHSWVDFIYQ